MKWDIRNIQLNNNAYSHCVDIVITVTQKFPYFLQTIIVFFIFYFYF
jgi:hypothetical protein